MILFSLYILQATGDDLVANSKLYYNPNELNFSRIKIKILLPR